MHRIDFSTWERDPWKPLIGTAPAALLLGSLLLLSHPATALNLNGAWATSADQCTNVFVRQGGKPVFAEMSDLHGGGFIIDGSEIVGKFARCKIKARKDNGPIVNLIAACATDIMLSSVQFTLRELDANSVVRLFPGIEEMEIRYHRCPSP